MDGAELQAGRGDLRLVDLFVGDAMVNVIGQEIVEGRGDAFIVVLKATGE